MSKNRILCIGRTLGSDGREIGKAAAEALKIPCYDRALLDDVLQTTDVPAERLQKYDEKRVPSFFYSLLYEGSDQTLHGKDGSEVLFELQRRFILEKAEAGPCVFIGRCADGILEKENAAEVVSVFITSPAADRVKRVADWKNLSEKEALSQIHKIDRHRKSYYEFHTGKNWGDPANYDLVLNSSAWERTALIELICTAYRNFA